LITVGFPSATEMHDYSHLSSVNLGFKKSTVRVASGAEFIYQVVPVEVLRTHANAIYAHIHKESGQCYIGITEQRVLERWTRGNNYRQQRRFGNALKKYGWDAFHHFVLAFADDRKSLENAEVDAIRHAGGHKSRFTYNLSPGGDLVAENDRPLFGVFLPTGKTRIFKSSSAAARILGFRNTDAASAVARGERSSKDDWWFRFEEDAFKTPPEAWGEELRLTNVRKRFGKTVAGINLSTHERRVFPTFSEAARALSISQSLISQSVRKQVLSAGGWCFFYEGSAEILPERHGVSATRAKRDRKVFSINLKTGERQEFKNCTAADTALSLHKGAAAAVAAGDRLSAGEWFFSYSRDIRPPARYRGAVIAQLKSKPLIAINIASGHQTTFDSAKSAAVALGMSRAAISKSISSNKSAKGFHFKFI